MPYLGRLIDREGKMLYGWKVINRERKTKGDVLGQKMRCSKQGIIFLVGKRRYNIHATNVRKRKPKESMKERWYTRIKRLIKIREQRLLEARKTDDSERKEGN